NRIACREGLDRALVHRPVMIGYGKRVRLSSGHRHVLRAPSEELAQHVLQNAAVAHVEHLLRRLDAGAHLEFDGAAVLTAGADAKAARLCKSARHAGGDAGDVELLAPGQTEAR